MALSATDLFTESFFQKGYVMMYLILAASTFTAFKVTISYIKNLSVS